MKTMNKITPFLVTKDTIRYKSFSINADNGCDEVEDQNQGDVFFVKMVLTHYSRVPYDRVFMPYDNDGVHNCDDPSCFLMKKVYSNWYLTGDSDTPLGFDNSVYDKVWMVVDTY